MDNRLLCEVTEGDIRTYDENGVVHLPGAISMDWVERIREATDRLLENPGPLSTDLNRGGPGRFAFESFMSNYDPDFRALVLDSPLGEIAAKITRSSKINFIYDFFFVKEPQTPHKTTWHQDYPAACCHGQQVAGTWMPLDVVTYDSGSIEYIKGSHKWNRWFVFPEDTEVAPEDYSKTFTKLPDEESVDPAEWGEKFELQPDFDAMLDQYEIITFDTEPGDIVVNNLLTLHGAQGNATDRRRRAIGGRWVGDDAVFARRQGQDNINIPAKVDLKDGDRFPADHQGFPRVWPRTGPDARPSA